MPAADIVAIDLSNDSTVDKSQLVFGGSAVAEDDPVVENPTWFGQIRDFFTETDIAHMQAKGLDLSVYDTVAGNGWNIYGVVSSGYMPPDPLPKWSANRQQTFINWLNRGCPKGTPEVAPAEMLAAAAAPRLRKEVTQLSEEEIQALKAAFTGIMNRDPSDAQSYFAIAGVHWYPAIDLNPRFHCLHHENRFLAWHRMHLLAFEDALRSVPGCESVTLPYWDITTLRVPDLFSEAPFAEYVAQAPIGHGYDPFTSSRNDPAQIVADLRQFKVVEGTSDALRKPSWEQFNATYWGVHDNGHVSCGTTMGDQGVASFDPIFWFYHCGLDRVWLQWQRAASATTLSGFKSTCSGSTIWLDNPQAGALPPFSATAADAVTLSEVAYEAVQEMAAMDFVNRTGNVAAAQHFRIDGNDPLSIRVKDIDRTAIPGTFVVLLLADGEEVARQAFFQPDDPKACVNCGENPKVPIDFKVSADQVLNKDLSVEIHVPAHEEIGTRFPLSRVGSPTINVRHLLEGE